MKLISVLTLSVVTVLATACAPVEEPAAELATTSTLSYVEEGELLYGEHCGACHGLDGDGTAAGQSLLGADYAADVYSDTRILATVSDGVEPTGAEWNGMDPITTLSHSDIARITSYLRELQQSE